MSIDKESAVSTQYFRISLLYIDHFTLLRQWWNNKLPPNIKEYAHKIKKLRSAVKRDLILNLFYSMD
jgi:hypothetical protein